MWLVFTLVIGAFIYQQRKLGHDRQYTFFQCVGNVLIALTVSFGILWGVRYLLFILNVLERRQ